MSEAGPRGHFGFVRIRDRAKVGRRTLFLPNVLAFKAVPSSIALVRFD